MDIVTGNFYFISDEFFDVVNDVNLKKNYDDTKRPHYFAFRDKKAFLLWLIPCSSKIDKFDNIINKRKMYNKRNDTIKIVNVQDRKTVLLLQDMFPIAEKYIESQYIRRGQPFKISNPEIIKDIEHSARRVIILIRHGVKFTPTQPDVQRIEKIMLSDEMENTQDFDMHM